MESWLLWNDGTHSPAFNMAADEVLLAHAAELDAPLIRLYRWDRPALSIGCAQRYPATEAERFTVVRRPTGGGHVRHDCDLTYTAVIPAGHPVAALNRMESYRIFHEAMLPMLEKMGLRSLLQQRETPGVDRATMQCFASPSRFDLVAPQGEKYAGAAQRRTRAGILHQGSIQIPDADWNRVADTLQEALQDHFGIRFRDMTIPDRWREEAAALARAKYESDEWNHAAQY